jgi:hypothetical protein
MNQLCENSRRFAKEKVPAINEKKIETESFSFLLRCCWVAVYTNIMIFILCFTLRCRQADIIAMFHRRCYDPAINYCRCRYRRLIIAVFLLPAIN